MKLTPSGMNLILSGFAILILNSPNANADAAWISGGGNPQHMNEEHPAVALQNETVDIHIG